uniref:Uncharacterized protein MANES_12G120400 n=1 Tax=Rhizophora mucronata TaxID=61149 RepID=A0A2P2MYQ8_RHIMU
MKKSMHHITRPSIHGGHRKFSRFKMNVYLQQMQQATVHREQPATTTTAFTTQRTTTSTHDFPGDFVSRTHQGNAQFSNSGMYT